MIRHTTEQVLNAFNRMQEINALNWDTLSDSELSILLDEWGTLTSID